MDVTSGYLLNSNYCISVNFNKFHTTYENYFEGFVIDVISAQIWFL